MATTSNRKSEILIVCNAQQAQEELLKFKNRLKAARQEYKELVDVGDTGSARFVELNREIKNLSKTVSVNENNLNRVNNVLRNLSNSSLRQVSRAYRDLKKAMQGMSENDPGLLRAQNDLEKLRLQMKKLQGEARKTGDSFKDSLDSTFKSVGSYMIITQVFSFLAEKMRDVIGLNLKYSDQLADIRKVSGLAARDVNKLSNQLAKIDTRTTIEELGTIAYEGAKLGFGDFGVAGLESFVKAANKVNVALREELGDEALTHLSKMVEVMGLIPKMGVERAMMATGSAMFQLSASSTASADQIVEFSKRLLGVAKTAGITTDQILAMGSASDSLALMPEVAATAFSKLIVSMQTSHNLIEKSLEIEPGTISNLFSAGKLMDAIVLVFEKMKEKGNMNALGDIFKDLGSDGQRLVTVMQTMASEVDILKKHLSVAEESFASATAIEKEYAIQQETAQALMERASNIWEKAFVNPDGVSAVQEIAQAWYDFSKSVTSGTSSMLMAKALFSQIVLIIKTLINILPALITAMYFKGVSMAIMLVVHEYKELGKSLFMTTLRTQGLTAAWKTLNNVQRANVLVLIASLVMQLCFWMVELMKNTEEAAGYMEGFDASLRGVKSAFAVAEDEAKRYRQAIDDAAEGSAERAAAIKSFNDKFGQYLTNLLTEESTVKDVAEAYERVNRALQRKAVLELKEGDLQKHYNPRVGWAAEKLYDYGEIAEGSSKGSQYNNTWLKGVMDDPKNNSVESVTQLVANRLGVSEEVVEDALKKRNSATIPQEIITGSYTATTSTGINVTTNSTRALTPEERMVYAAARASSQHLSAENARRRIDDKYKPYTDQYAADDAIAAQELGDLEQEAADKEAEKKRKEELQKLRKKNKDDLKLAQNEARAIIDSIKNFYQRQITEVLRTAKENNWDQTLLQSTVDAITARQNLALSNVRQAIAGINTKGWEEFKGTMGDDMKETTVDEVNFNQSQVLLNRIQSNNVSDLSKKIIGLSRNLGLPTNAATDEIWMNASLNEQENETVALRRLRERNALLLEDNYTAKVDDNYTNSMTQLGFFDVTAEQSDVLSGGGDAAKELLDKRAEDINRVFASVREKYVELLSIPDEKGRVAKGSLMTLLFGEDWENSPNELQELLNLGENDIQLFYQELLKYSDDYTEAQKKARERQKKILDFRWQNTDAYRSNQNEQSRMEMAATGVAQHNNGGSDTSDLPYKDAYGTKHFMSSMGADPEVEAYRLKMEAADAYYKFLKAHNADAATLRDAEQAILQSELAYVKSVASQMQQRVNDVYALAQPVENFGTSMGEAFATMTEDAEAGRKAVKKAIGDMINGFLKQTVTMTQEYIKRRIMQSVNDRLTSAAMKQASSEQIDIEKKKQSELTDTVADGGKDEVKEVKDIGKDLLKQEKKDDKKLLGQEENLQGQLLETQEIGGQAQEMLNVEVKGNIQDATQQIGQQTMQLQQAQTQQEVQTESAKTQANTTMGIASGASKIIGSLGWWGIPLIAVITALLNGLLSFAMSKVSSLFGGGGGDDGGDAGGAVKLVSGMLTYDSGNVQAFKGIEDGKSYPVVGNDGKVYAATDGGELSTGLVKDPITTFVNGQPALVAERGPEMVIGRETTAAMMMARPDILAEIVKFDRMRSGRTYRAFDEGNASDFNISIDQGGTSAEDMVALRDTIGTLSSVLATIQKNGLRVNKYGRGGLVDAAESGRNFMRNNSGDRLWRKR